MLEVLEVLDGKIIEKLTKFSHWFQKLTGLTCYFFVKIGLFISTLAALFRILNYFVPVLLHKGNLVDLVFMVFFVYVFGKEIHKCNKAEESLFSSEIIKVNKMDIDFRMFCLLASIVFVIIFAPGIYKAHYKIIKVIGESCFFIGLSVYGYFMEITPLPPGKSKAHKWVEGLLTAQPQLEPIPVKPNK